MLSNFNNKCYKKGNPKKMIVFIHGYNGSPESINYAVQSLYEKIEDAVIVVPRAPFPCEKDEKNLQWLSFYAEDPNVRFRASGASVEEIFGIFNRLWKSFADVAKQMNEFVDEQQKLWKINDGNTYIIGFSQGAMITIATSLLRKNKIGGAVSIAGIVPGFLQLPNEINSKPKFLLLHGKDDVTVQYKTLPTTINWFKEQNIEFKNIEFDKLAHRMNDDEMKEIADFISF